MPSKTIANSSILSNLIRNGFGSVEVSYERGVFLEKGVFPDDLKIVKVTPVDKAGDKRDISNYRPISVLP